MSLSIPELVARWQGSRLTERSAAQQHFLNLCEALGQPSPAAVDQTGETYTFEKGVRTVTGGKGFADVWKRGAFAWEYKGPHKDLGAAYQQLLKYREDLENPPLLVVCDLERFEVHTNFTGTVKRVYSFSLQDLLRPEPTPTSLLPPLEVLRALWEEPNRLRPQATTAQVTEAAAREFARLSASLRARGEEPERSARFLIRLLFCLFSEDTGLLPRGLFTRLVERTRERPTEFTRRLQGLFEAMATGGAFGADDIAHFNGGLFADDEVLELSADDMTVLHRACALDWKSIEPAIFGTLFERSLDPSKRSQLGAHYTGRDDIMLIVEPVLLAPLRRRWTEVREQADALVERRDAAAPAQRTRLQGELSRLLMGFAGEVAGVRVLDPACGSGNFLYVALKELLDLEKEVVTYAARSGVGAFFPQVEPSQLYGIERDPYAHELAQVVVWIGYIQWLSNNGFGVPSDPILKPLHNIIEMDAILGYDEQGRPCEPAWPEADVIIGNPPFLGGNKIRQELRDETVDALFELYKGRVPAFSDLVCYWFERSRALIAEGKVKRAGLLATNSIRGGVNRRVLERIKQTGDIFMAWSDRPGVLNGAAVRISMIGFDNGAEQVRVLDGLPVTAINANLTGAADLSETRTLIENQGLGFRGNQKGGAFDIDRATAQQMLTAPLNPNGRPNSDVVRQWYNGLDITRRARDMWIIDFGVDTPREVAALYELPFEYVREYVYPERMKNRRSAYARKWWQYNEPRPGMRAALAGLSRFAVTPHVSKHRLVMWLPIGVVPDHQLIVFAREDDYFFGVLHSRPHALWALRMGTALEDRPRYTPTPCFETYPFPWPPGKEPRATPASRR